MNNINLPFETYGTLYSYEELINRLDNDGLYPLESNGPQGPEGLTLIKDIYDCGIKELYVDIEKIHKTNKQVGIDLGLKDFVITSDNNKFKNNIGWDGR